MKTMKTSTLVLKVAFSCILVCAIFMSTLFFSRFKDTSSIEALQQKREICLVVMTAAAATSTALAGIPDDTTTPLANEVMGICDYLLIALSSIMLQQFIASISRYISFMFLIPIACALIGCAIWFVNERMRFVALITRVVLLALCVLFTVPLSIKLDEAITRAFSTDQYVDEVVAASDAIVQAAEETGITEGETVTEEEEKGFWQRVLDFLGNVVNTAVNYVQYAKDLVDKYMMVVATLILTSCLVPILSVVILWFTLCWAVRGIVSCLPGSWPRWMVWNSAPVNTTPAEK